MLSVSVWFVMSNLQVFHVKSVQVWVFPLSSFVALPLIPKRDLEKQAIDYTNLAF